MSRFQRFSVNARIIPGPLARAITSRAFGASEHASELIDESGMLVPAEDPPATVGLLKLSVAPPEALREERRSSSTLQRTHGTARPALSGRLPSKRGQLSRLSSAPRRSANAAGLV